MSKPQWTDAPDWAYYLTGDAEEQYVWHEKEPIPCGRHWIFTGRIKVVEPEPFCEARPNES